MAQFIASCCAIWVASYRPRATKRQMEQGTSLFSAGLPSVCVPFRGLVFEAAIQTLECHYICLPFTKCQSAQREPRDCMTTLSHQTE